MTVNGEGRSPTRQHVFALAQGASIPSKEAERIIEEVCEGVSQWKKFTMPWKIAQERIEYVNQHIEDNIRRLTP